MAWTKKPLPEKIILEQPVIPAGCAPQTAGSHEQEITGIGREIIFGHKKRQTFDWMPAALIILFALFIIIIRMKC